MDSADLPRDVHQVAAVNNDTESVSRACGDYSVCNDGGAVMRATAAQVEAVPEELEQTMQILRQEVVAKQRDPLTKFSDAVRRLNYGDSPFLQPLSLRAVRRIDVRAACRYCSHAFQNPAEFTLCFAGARTAPPLP